MGGTLRPITNGVAATTAFGAISYASMDSRLGRMLIHGILCEAVNQLFSPHESPALVGTSMLTRIWGPVRNLSTLASRCLYAPTESCRSRRSLRRNHIV